MKHQCLFFITVLLLGCNSKQNEVATEGTASTAVTDTAAQTAPATPADTKAVAIPNPPGLTKLGEASGDLDKDGQAETVIVYDTQRQNKDEMGTERDLHIFKSKNGAWELWHKSSGAIMPSESGGLMGDPFQEVSIENGSIVLFHLGGSRFKWNYTHRFRFQDSAWKLIGATSNNGAPCEYWKNYDYNLSTGAINYEKTTEDCTESEDNPKITKVSKTFTHKLKTLPNMDGFEPGGSEIKLKGMEEPFYF